MFGPFAQIHDIQFVKMSSVPNQDTNSHEPNNSTFSDDDFQSMNNITEFSLQRTTFANPNITSSTFL